MQTEIIVVGDTELGGGTITDDFIADKSLSQLLLTYAEKKSPVDFICNGDTFDFLKCPYLEKDKITYPRHITSEVSVSKLKMIYDAHKPVFQAWREFVKLPTHNLYFVIGNHDHDLFYPEVRQKIKSLFRSRKNVHFVMKYEKNNTHVEHGHQHDFLNRIKPDHPFLKYKKQRILNIPWVSFGIISGFLKLKEEHPFMERIKPLPILFSHHHAIVRKLNIHSIFFLLKNILLYPLHYHFDPTWTFPRELLREIYRRFRNVHWDVDDVVKTFKRKRRGSLHKNKIYVFGHVHTKYVEEKEGWVIIHSDTWRDEYFLDKDTKVLTPKTKQYVHILAEDNTVQWELRAYPITRSTFYFDDVMKDEVKFLTIAASEEGYHYPFTKPERK